MVVASQNLGHVDFRNYSYPWSGTPSWSDHLQWLDPSGGKKVHLTDGHWSDQTELDELPEGSIPIPGLQLESVKFGDVTGAGQDDAIVVIRYDSGGTQFSYFVYIYSFVKVRPNLLAYFHAGDRASSGLYQVYAQNMQLVVELFDPSRKTGDCCASGYIRTRYRWESGKFKVTGPREFGKPKVSSRLPVSTFGLHQ
jgi:hypothetical protein